MNPSEERVRHYAGENTEKIEAVRAKIRWAKHHIKTTTVLMDMYVEDLEYLPALEDDEVEE